MHDSGERQHFLTGAVRDTATGKPRPDLISPFAEERLGAWMALGALKYGERNYEKGMPLSRFLASLCRHLTKFKQGQTDEDHLAAILFNASAIAHGQAMLQRGKWPKELDDLPDYGAKAPEPELNQQPPAVALGGGLLDLLAYPEPTPFIVDPHRFPPDGTFAPMVDYPVITVCDTKPKVD